MKQIFLFCLVLILFSCSEHGKGKIIIVKFFPKEIRLVREEIKVPPVLPMVGEVLLMDSVLVTLDLKTDTIFKAFKLPAFNYIGGSIFRGKGPNEEVFIDPFIRSLGENQFLYRTPTSIKIAKYNFKNSKIKITSAINLPSKLMDLYNVFKLEGNLLYGTDMYRKSDKEFIAYNPETKQISDYGPEYPKLEKNINDPISRNNILAKVTATKPDKILFASVYASFPILRICSNNGRLLVETRYENGQDFPDALISNRPSQFDKNKVMSNYRKIKATNHFIYALYIGKTKGQLGKKGLGLNDFSNEIHVWDWRGNPIEKILLDKEIFAFDVSKDDNYIICTSLNSLDKLYKYSLISMKK